MDCLRLIFRSGKELRKQSAMQSSATTHRSLLDTLIDAGVSRQQQGDHKAAAGWYERALALDPQNFDTLQLLGLARVQTGDTDAGIALLRRSLSVQPRQLPALNNLAAALRSASRTAEAIATYRRALEIDPKHVVVLTSLGSALLEWGDTREAARCFAQALEADEKDPEIYYWIGRLYQRLGRPADAVLQFRHALRLSPSLGKALDGLGVALDEAGDTAAALETFRAAEKLSPALGLRVHRSYAALRLADWSDWYSDVAALSSADLASGYAGDPLRMMTLPVSAALLRQGAERFVAQNAAVAITAPIRIAGSPARLPSTHPHSTHLPSARAPSAHPPRARAPSTRIRLAYLSPDLRDHPVGNIVAEVFELRDRAQFEIYTYAWGPGSDTPVRARIAAACDHFQEVSSLSDREVAEKVSADGIDIAVDLAGHTGNSRCLIVAARPAPVQVSWLGFPGTTGAPYMDYIVADGFTIPHGDEEHFTERVARLPHTYLPYDRTRLTGAPRPRESDGLPADAFVLGCFGQIRKINPLIFGVWMQILRAVPHAILWLSNSDAGVMMNLRREAEARGVSGERLLFASSAPDAADYLARYRNVDLALDTFPYGSHSTAADVLWAGCPLVALAGATFVSRVSGSVLKAAGFPELITWSLAEYRQRVLTLIENPVVLAELRERVAAARSKSALFDTPDFVRNLERAFLHMWSRHLRGDAPAHFSLAASARNNISAASTSNSRRSMSPPPPL